MQQIPVYVINLDRRPDRWAVMSEQLDRLGIEAERVPAVDARLLAKQEAWEAQVNCNDDTWSVDVGSMACILSHRQALSLFLDTGHPVALILEDDAELASQIGMFLTSVDWWPSGALAVRLEDAQITGDPRHRKRWLGASEGLAPNGRTLHRLLRFAPGSAAYLIAREGAGLVIEAGADPEMPTDHILFHGRRSVTARRLRTVQVLPAMARQRWDATESNISAWRDLADNRAGGGTRFRRNMAELPRKAGLHALRAVGVVHRVPVTYHDGA